MGLWQRLNSFLHIYIIRARKGGDTGHRAWNFKKYNLTNHLFWVNLRIFKLKKISRKENVKKQPHKMIFRINKTAGFIDETVFPILCLKFRTLRMWLYSIFDQLVFTKPLTFYFLEMLLLISIPLSLMNLLCISKMDLYA